MTSPIGPHRTPAWRTDFGPPRSRMLTLLAAGLALTGAGFLLPALWVPAAVLLVGAARDLWLPPALRLEPEGFTYVKGLHREYAPWSQVSAVRVRAERHFLAFGRQLEIDLSDDTLIVLSSLQLGVPADDAEQAMLAVLTGQAPPQL